MSQKAPTADDLADLIDLYVVANTPEYLFKTLRDSIPVQIMSRTQSHSALAALYKQSAEKRDRSIKDVVIGYSALAAIMRGDRPAATKALRGLDLSRLDWAKSMAAYFLDQPVSNRTEIVGNSSPPPTIELKTIKSRGKR